MKLRMKNETSRVLDNFEPFNEIWFKSCFYQAFFAILHHFNKPSLAYLANNLFLYDIDDSNPMLKLEPQNIDFTPEEEIFKLLEIGVRIKNLSSNIIGDLITSINNNCPVIIFIDCFYESIRFDAYKKHHFPHTLLIYGYDKAKRIFHILEHNYIESMLYEKRTISYLDVRNSYNGYLENLYGIHNHATYFEYYPQESSSSSNSNVIREELCLFIYKSRLLGNSAYSGLSGRLFRRHPDSKPETSGHLIDDLILQ